MGKPVFFWGLVSGVMATLAGYIWDRVYYFAMLTDYSEIIHLGCILAASMVACMLAIGGYSLLHRFIPKHRDIIFNFLLSIITIGSLVWPLSVSLPLHVEFPEFFPALAMPMHFFPAMALFTLKPLFLKT